MNLKFIIKKKMLIFLDTQVIKLELYLPITPKGVLIHRKKKFLQHPSYCYNTIHIIAYDNKLVILVF